MAELRISSISVVSVLVEEIPKYKVPELAAALHLNDEYNHWKSNCANRTCFDAIMFLVTSWTMKQRDAGNFSSLIAVLNEICYTKAAERLEQIVSDRSKLTKSANSKKVFFDCLPHYLNSKLYGRQKELATLESIFTSRRRLALVGGLGGIGKSALVREFAKQSNTYRHCLLFRADDSSSLQNDIFELGQTLGIELKEQTPRFCNTWPKVKTRSVTVILELCIRDIRSRFPAQFLLIFDNVNELHSGTLTMSIISNLRKYEDIYICVTSRESMLICGRDILFVCLPELDFNSTFELATDKLPLETPTNIKKLCNRMNGYPLGIIQAVCYIKHQQIQILEGGKQGNSYTIENYLEVMHQNPKDIFETNYDANDTRTLLSIWDINFKQLTDTQNALLIHRILDTLSFINPNGIELIMLKELAFGDIEQTKDQEMLMKRCLISLKGVSLIKAENNVISIHRLVQEVVRLKNPNLTTTIRRIAYNALTFLQRNKVDTKALVHLECIWKNISKSYVQHVPYGEIAKLKCRWMMDIHDFKNCATFSKEAVQFLDRHSPENAVCIRDLKCFIGVTTLVD